MLVTTVPSRVSWFCVFAFAVLGVKPGGSPTCMLPPEAYPCGLAATSRSLQDPAPPTPYPTFLAGLEAEHGGGWEWGQGWGAGISCKYCFFNCYTASWKRSPQAVYQQLCEPDMAQPPERFRPPIAKSRVALTPATLWEEVQK